MNPTARVRAAVASSLMLGLGLGVIAPASDAGGPSHKTFSETLWVDPTGSAAGTEWPTNDAGITTSQTITAAQHHFYFRITNTSTGPNAVPYGSVQIQVPTGFTGISSSLVDAPTNFSIQGSGTASPITVVSTGSTGTGIGSLGSIVIEVIATAPATGVCPPTWVTGVKQSNDFSGSGNEFTGNSVSTPVAGSVHIEWSTQPSDVQYNTTMSPSPTAVVKNACGATDTTFSGVVTATDVSTESTHPAFTATAASGVATFSTVSYSTWGSNHVLHATAIGVTDCATTEHCYSSSFHVYQLLTPCLTNGTTPCGSGTLTGPNGQTRANINAAAGTSSDVLTVDIGGTPDNSTCESQTGLTVGFGETVSFDVGDTRTKRVTMTLPRTYVNQIPNNGTPFMDICLVVPGTDTGFTDKFGTTDVHAGLLGDCGTFAVPCVVSRGKRGGDEIIVFDLPAGDPKTMWF